MAKKTAEAHLVQYINRVVDVPVDKEPRDAEDSGSSCRKCYSDVEAIIDIRPDSVVTVAVQTQTFEDLVNERDSTECDFVDSDTRYGWNPSTTLSGTRGRLPRIDEQVLESSNNFESPQAAGRTLAKRVDYLVVLINGVEV